MTKAEATTKAAKRTNKFRSDPEIPTGSATAADYRKSGYDRGHLAPAADMAFSGQGRQFLLLQHESAEACI